MKSISFTFYLDTYVTSISEKIEDTKGLIRNRQIIQWPKEKGQHDKQ